MIDGKRQREALSSAERAIDQLAAGNYEAAIRAAETAAERDQVEAYRDLPQAILAAVSDMRSGGLTTATRNSLLAAVGPGPLRAQVEGIGLSE